MFTGALFLLAGIILLFFAGKFLSAWKRTPLFSTLIAALVMIVIQTYSLASPLTATARGATSGW